MITTKTVLALATIVGATILIKQSTIKGKKSKLIELSRQIEINGETGFEPIIEKMTDDEISTVFDFVIAKKTLTPTLRAKFLTLSEKYNIFT